MDLLLRVYRFKYNRPVKNRQANENASDEDAFARAMAEENVVRLPDSRRRARAAPPVRLPPVATPAGGDDEESGEDFATAGVDRREIRKLKRGEYLATGRLDLHGLTTAAACASVEQFLDSSRHRCIYTSTPRPALAGRGGGPEGARAGIPQIASVRPRLRERAAGRWRRRRCLRVVATGVTAELKSV